MKTHEDEVTSGSALSRDYARELGALWNWVPAFRAIAEAQGLVGASEQLHVTPSALSRSLSQLEDQLGVALFDRVGRRLMLNQKGKEFLVAARLSMRVLHDGVTAARQLSWRGQFRVWASADVAQLVAVPAILNFRTEHPHLEPQLATGAIEWAAELLAGSLDVAITDKPAHNGDLEWVSVGEITFGIFCRPRHPALKKSPSPQMRFDFVCVVGSEAAFDERAVPCIEQISMLVDTTYAAVEVTRQTDLVIVLPLPLQKSSGLIRLGTTTWKRTVFAVRRKALGEDRAGHFVQLVSSLLAAS